MKIFITGGAGFIGRYVVAELQRRGHRLLLLTRKSTNGHHQPKTAYVYGQLGRPATWRQTVRRFRPEAAIHLAWEGLAIPDYGVVQSRQNLNYGLDLYEFLAQIGCKKILTTGTCWEYGNVIGKVDETMGLKRLNAFSAAKNALHAFGVEIAKSHQIQFLWARPFFVYGPGQRPASLIPYLIQCRRSGTEPTLKNPRGGNDFIFVADVAEAIVQILLRCRAPEATYNIGSGRLTSVHQVVDLLFRRRRRPSRYRQARGFYAETKRLRQDIGWKPKISLIKGINQTIIATDG